VNKQQNFYNDYILYVLHGNRFEIICAHNFGVVLNEYYFKTSTLIHNLI